jgi:hypothetical protein
MNPLAEDLKDSMIPDHVLIYSCDHESPEALEEWKRSHPCKRPIVVLTVDSQGNTVWGSRKKPDRDDYEVEEHPDPTLLSGGK